MMPSQKHAGVLGNLVVISGIMLPILSPNQSYILQTGIALFPERPASPWEPGVPRKYLSIFQPKLEYGDAYS